MRPVLQHHLSVRVGAALRWQPPGVQVVAPVGLFAQWADGAVGVADPSPPLERVQLNPAAGNTSATFSIVNTGGQPLTLGVPAITGPAQALLQWRNDGQHLRPVVLEVERGGAPTPAPSPAMPADSGGGCSVAAVPRARAPVWAFLLALAVWRLLRPRAQPGSGRV